MSKQIVIMAIDIEASGQNVIKNGILSIGYYVGDCYGNKIIKGRFSFQLEKEMVFEKRCVDEFWKNHIDVLDVLQQEAQPIKEQISNFINLVDNLDEQYNLMIISDNKDFDIGFINYYLAKYLDRNPLNFKFGNGEYRQIYDTDSYSRGAAMMDYTKPWTSDKDIMKMLNFEVNKTMTHFPDDDAEYIYTFHTTSIKKLREF